MELFANELSLHGQFVHVSDFYATLKQVWNCKEIANRYDIPVFCLRTIAERLVTDTLTFRQAVAPNKNIARAVMTWIDKNGPFWDETQQHDPDEYFDYHGEVVTEHSLGEVAFRHYHDGSSATLSFHPSQFTMNPLVVTWRHSDTQQEVIQVPNFWDCELLEAYVKTMRPEPTSWAELLEHVQKDFTNLVFLDSLMDGLNAEPFNKTIATQITHRLSILNTLKSCYDEQGKRTQEGHDILQQYFHGKKALFTDESESNKQKFRQELTFKTPDGTAIFCPEHGKISYRTFRIHYSAIRHDEPLYIAYIGYKITR